jgi:hypothetical protein
MVYFYEKTKIPKNHISADFKKKAHLFGGFKGFFRIRCNKGIKTLPAMLPAKLHFRLPCFSSNPAVHKTNPDKKLFRIIENN